MKILTSLVSMHASLDFLFLYLCVALVGIAQGVLEACKDGCRVRKKFLPPRVFQGLRREVMQNVSLQRKKVFMNSNPKDHLKMRETFAIPHRSRFSHSSTPRPDKRPSLRSLPNEKQPQRSVKKLGHLESFKFQST